MIGKASVGDASALEWFKSSYSDSNESGDCVEVALEWHKSSYSSSSNGEDCVEIAVSPQTIHIRDSKVDDGPHLDLAPRAWSHFLTYASQDAEA
ncbi:DUF397 domain-containing protein [Streptomyces sp. Je 1-369]|uniref:DUF397 domain-containing protein n=1 Tax=Streptomyces sp. Je 1-369 TaxID=2966192 RepID=UPI0022861B5F|nr:DUF397 domain-containing protein [Streptomyces sp. Je 1-369]WAL95774.1 DUF397 domain-containing protein [Streptomyces sp. Je 1-369]